MFKTLSFLCLFILTTACSDTNNTADGNYDDVNSPGNSLGTTGNNANTQTVISLVNGTQFQPKSMVSIQTNYNFEDDTVMSFVLINPLTLNTYTIEPEFDINGNNSMIFFMPEIPAGDYLLATHVGTQSTLADGTTDFNFNQQYDLNISALTNTAPDIDAEWLQGLINNLTTELNTLSTEYSNQTQISLAISSNSQYLNTLSNDLAELSADERIKIAQIIWANILSLDNSLSRVSKTDPYNNYLYAFKDQCTEPLLLQFVADRKLLVATSALAIILLESSTLTGPGGLLASSLTASVFIYQLSKFMQAADNLLNNCLTQASIELISLMNADPLNKAAATKRHKSDNPSSTSILNFETGKSIIFKASKLQIADQRIINEFQQLQDAIPNSILDYLPNKWQQMIANPLWQGSSSNSIDNNTLSLNNISNDRVQLFITRNSSSIELRAEAKLAIDEVIEFSFSLSDGETSSTYTARLSATFDNTPPIASISFSDNTPAVQLGESILFIGTATDAQSGNLKGDWYVDNLLTLSSSNTFSFIPIKIPASEFQTIKYRVSDEQGASAEDSVEIQIYAGPITTIGRFSDNTGKATQGRYIDALGNEQFDINGYDLFFTDAGLITRVNSYDGNVYEFFGSPIFYARVDDPATLYHNIYWISNEQAPLSNQFIDRIYQQGRAFSSSASNLIFDIKTALNQNAIRVDNSPKILELKASSLETPNNRIPLARVSVAVKFAFEYDGCLLDANSGREIKNAIRDYKVCN